MLIDNLLDNSDVDLSGLKIAKVINNSDPLSIERIRVRILGVHDFENETSENSIWANHCAPSRDDSGQIPDEGNWVYGMFLDKNDPMSFVWFGYCRTVA